MELSSSEFENNGKIPEKYALPRQNVNPPLNIKDVPEDAKSLVLIMDDPDAKEPAGKVWDHWVVFNMPPSIREIPEDWDVEGTQGTTDYRRNEYGGPNPPDGMHTYVFKIYALDTKLDLDQKAKKKDVEEAMKNHIMEKTKLKADFEPIN